MANQQDKMLHTTHGGGLTGGHTVWQYTGRTGWVVKKRSLNPGFESGDPPQGKGKYEGEIKRTPGVRGGGTP